MRRNLVRAALLLVCLACVDVANVAEASAPTFYARRDYPDNGTWVAVADTNGDGIPDVIEWNGQGSVAVLFGSGYGTFRPGPVSHPGMSPLTFAAADLNGDHNADLVLAGTQNETGGGLGVLASPWAMAMALSNPRSFIKPAPTPTPTSSRLATSMAMAFSTLPR